MQTFTVGDKVRTAPGAFQRLAGFIVAIHPQTPAGHSACASVYCGGYESVKVPLADLQLCTRGIIR